MPYEEGDSFQSCKVLSALLRGEAQILGGVLELANLRAAGDDGQASTLSSKA